MTFASKYNKSEIAFAYRLPEGSPFVKLHDLVGANGIDTVYPLRGVYISTKGRYGEEPVLISDGIQVNAPKHILDVVKNIMSSDDDINTINNGKVGFRIYEYKNSYGINYGINWVDL